MGRWAGSELTTACSEVSPRPSSASDARCLQVGLGGLLAACRSKTAGPLRVTTMCSATIPLAAWCRAAAGRRESHIRARRVIGGVPFQNGGAVTGDNDVFRNDPARSVVPGGGGTERVTHSG